MNVGFEAVDYSILEGGGEVEVCAVLSGFINIPVSVTFSVLDPPGRDQSECGSQLLAS